MYIVIDARFFRRTHGGIARYTQALVRELAHIDTKNRYTLVVRDDEEADAKAFLQEFQLPKDHWTIQATTIRHYSVPEQTEFGSFLRSLKPGLVHFTNFNHPIGYQDPFVVTYHDLTILKYPVGTKQTNLVMQAGFRLVSAHAIRAAKKIITVSETSKADLISYLHADAKKIAVTYEGVDQDYQPINLPQRGRSQQVMQEKYGIHPPYLLFVSQWRPHKGILTLLKIYTEFRKRYPRLAPQLVIVGKANPNYPAIPAEIAAHPYKDSICTPGFVGEDDLPKFYQGAEAFLFPSEYEGFGLTPLEAMASGTPVVALEATCLPEILGDAALLVKPGDVSGWVEAMHTLLTNRDQWRDARAKGLAHVRRYSWQKMAEETLAIYDQVG